MNKLQYNKSAKKWTSALPIGNGLTGVMIRGGSKVEKLSFNDSTLWSGYPKDYDNPESLANLDKARELIFGGKRTEAQRLTESKLTGGYSESYLPLGDLILKFKGLESDGYARELDLSNATHTVSTHGAIRTAFASYPDKVVIYRIDSDSRFGMQLTAKSKMKHSIIIDDGLYLCGQAPDYVAPNYLHGTIHPIKYDKRQGMSFCLGANIVTDGAVKYGSSSVCVENATSITLIMATATGYLGYGAMPKTDYEYSRLLCKKTLAMADKDYDSLYGKHVADYKSIYDRQELSLSGESNATTGELVRMAKSGNVKTELAELFYNYGKYLTIAGSRAGGMALNLQGIWNNKMRPAWSSNYTTNINTEMNYWGASGSNLGECLAPYVELVSGVMERGKATARVNYGCRGFACNHNVDIWRKTAPVRGDSSYMYSPLCGTWLANELYEHYRYGRINEYADKIQEIMAESVKFCCDYLVLHDGKYVTCPSASPEAKFICDGKTCSLDYASAFELGLVKQAFNNYLEYGQDKELLGDVREKLVKLYPLSEGDSGINEWHDNFPINEKGHRHFSPLYALYPGRVINYHSDAKEREWARKLFNIRLENCTWFVGWSGAWALSLAARLHDAKCFKRVSDSLLSKSIFENLFNIHPPYIFQIDGNLGYVAGINEALATVENGVIELLPALPIEWNSGSVRGLCVASGHELDFSWKGGKVTKLAVHGVGARILNANLASDLALNNCELIEARHG